MSTAKAPAAPSGRICEKYFCGSHLGFSLFWAGTILLTFWFLEYLESVYSITPVYQFSCFPHKVHNSPKICYISTPLVRHVFPSICVKIYFKTYQQ